MRSPRAGSDHSVARFRWRLPDPDPLRHVFAQRLGLAPATVQVLLRRGCRTEEDLRAFLRADLLDLPDPEGIPGMDRAASLVEEAVAHGVPIAVYGDYDADGVCACALLVRGLRALGAQVTPYLPHRLREGYGLFAAAVHRIAAGGARLLVAVDCGITAREEIAIAQRLGMRVVVVDHHEPPAHLPPADALVDPKLYPTGFREYCAAGLAWMLVQLLWTRKGRGPTADLLELAAIGTLADVVPLLGPNRILAKQGLARMPISPLPGLQALLRRVGVSERVTADDVVWRIAPRLNASGRLESAQLSLELLLTDDPEEAERLTAALEALNRERQRLQDAVVEEALGAAESLDPWNRAALVLWGEWHPGVLGIAAGKVREAFYRPTVLLSRTDRVARGSGRSVPEVNLMEALRACTPILEAFGGHAQAAGLRLPLEHLEAFRERFEEAVRFQVRPEDLVPTLMLDGELSLHELDDRLARELELLEPHGLGNPRPLFALRGLRVLRSRLVGQDGSHLHLWLSDGRRRVEAMGFGMAEWAERVAIAPARVDVAAHVEGTPWLDRRDVRLVVQDLRFPEGSALVDAGRLVARLFERASEYWQPDWVRLEEGSRFEIEVYRSPLGPPAAPGAPVRLGREPDHPEDPYAVRVEREDGTPLGYLPSPVAGRIGPYLDRGAGYRTVIVEAGPGGFRVAVEGKGGESTRASGGESLALRLLHGEVLPEQVRTWMEQTPQRRRVLVGGPGRDLWKALLVCVGEAAGRGARVVCTWPTHDLAEARWAQWRERLAECGVPAVRVHGMCDPSARFEARTRDDPPVVFTTWAYLRRHPELVEPGDLVVGESLTLPELARAHPGPVLWNLWTPPAAPPEGWAVAYWDRVRLDVVLNDRRGRGGPEAVAELMRSGERVVVFEASPQEAVRTAERLWTQFPDLRVAYDHPLLPHPLRVSLYALLSPARLGVLVCAGPPPEEASTQVDHVVWLTPQPQALFLLQAACAAPGRERATLHLAFGVEDVRRARQAWEEAYPSRRALAAVYRRLQGGTWPLASAQALPEALAILEELGVVERAEGRWKVRPGHPRADLRASERFREGEALRKALEQGIQWMGRASAVEILEAVAGPAAPPAG